MTDLTNSSDETLLRRSTAGDEQAFVALYRRRQSAVYRFALHMSGSSDLAEEVTQEVFLTVIRDGKRFDQSRGTVVSYLLGVARNHVLKLLERDRAYIGFEDETAELAQADCDLLVELPARKRSRISGKRCLNSPRFIGKRSYCAISKRSAMQKRLWRWAYRSEPFDRV